MRNCNGVINGIILPSGKHTKNYGKSHCFMGKSTISMAIFNSYVKLPEGNISHIKHHEATKETPCSKTFENWE
jgi:hypothetical protein